MTEYDEMDWLYEKVARSKYTVYDSRDYGGKRYLPIYIWDIKEIGEPSSVDIVFVEANGGSLKRYVKKLTFVPFEHEKLIGEVDRLGATVVKDTYTPDADNYYLVLKG